MRLCLLHLLLPLFCMVSGHLMFAQTFQKVYADPNGRYLIAHDVHPNVAGDFLLSGEYRDQRAHPFLIKSAPDGSPVWSKIYFPPDSTFEFPAGWNVRPLTDGDIYLHTQKSKNGAIQGQVLFKTNPAGDVLWSVYAPAVMDRYSISLSGTDCYLGGYHRPKEKLFLGKLNTAGQTLWEYQYTAGTFDLYRIFCQTPVTDQLLLAVGVEQKQPGGGSFGPNHTVLMQLDGQGNVVKKAFFPNIFIQALQPLPNGNIAFLARSEGIDWVGVGVMDADFNWQWFKEIRIGGGGIILKDIAPGQLSLSGDGQQLTSIFYLGGGGRLLLRHSLTGQLLTQTVYLAGRFGDALSNAGGSDFVRMANLSADQFIFGRPNTDGTAPDCAAYFACNLKLVDTVFYGSPIEMARIVFSCIQPESVQSGLLDIDVQDFCFDPGPINAHFTLTDSVICPGETIGVKRLQGIGTYPFGQSSWVFESAIPGSGSSAEIGILRYLIPGLYPVVHLFQVAGCLDTVTQYLKVDQAPEVHLGKDSTYCFGDHQILRAGEAPGNQYTWGNGFSSNTMYVTEGGTYAVTVVDAAGCIGMDAITLNFIAPETVALGRDTLVCVGQSIEIGPLKGTQNASYQWNSGQTSPYITVSSTGTYILSASTNACAFQDTLQVRFSDCPPCKVYAPNAFAPESSGDNAFFQLFSDCILDELKIWIYDRWGNRVFAAFSAADKWDGKLNGRPLAPGIYTYFAEFQMKGEQRQNTLQKVTGHVTLIK